MYFAVLIELMLELSSLTGCYNSSWCLRATYSYKFTSPYIYHEFNLLNKGIASIGLPYFILQTLYTLEPYYVNNHRPFPRHINDFDRESEV